MTRLIDADALSKKLCETTIFIKGGEIFQRMINDAPTIEPDGDTISRSKAVKDVSEWATDILHPDRLVKEDAIYILESLPSAETPTVSEKHQLSEEIPTNTPTNTSTDLISRQDALAEFRDGRDVYDIMESIEALPSAPDSRQRGEWVWDEDAVDWGIGAWVCNKCGSRPQTWWSTDRNKNPLICAGSHFCPNCGADMRKGGDLE